MHGSAPDIANKDIANPTALLLSSLMMLDHMNLSSYSVKIRKALYAALKEKNKRTVDLGGESKCSEFTDRLIKYL